MEGFTYGAPGAKKNIFYQLLPDIIKNSNFFGIIPLAVKAYNLAKEEMENKIDSRITQFTHSGDAIPKLGSVLYNTDGSSYALEDKANKNLHKSAILGQKSLSETVHIDHRKGRFTAFTAIAKSQEESLFSKIKNYFPNMFSKYHDMLRYSLNLEHESFSKGVELRDFKNSEDFTQNNPYVNRFKEFRSTLTRKIHVYNQDDPIMQHFLDRRKAQMTQDGRMIYRVKPDFAEMLSEMRNRAFANDIAKIAVSGLTQRKPT